MSANAPWSVKGIDAKAREVAKDLARRSGMTLGEWLNQMILEGQDVGALISRESREKEAVRPAQRSAQRYEDDDYADEAYAARVHPPYREVPVYREAPAYREPQAYREPPVRETPREPLRESGRRAAPFSSQAQPLSQRDPSQRDLRRSIFENRPRVEALEDETYVSASGDLGRVARAIETLGSRIEGSETRSASAVRGVSQAVESLLDRLERSESIHADTQSKLDSQNEEVLASFERLSRAEEDQSALAARLDQAERLIDAQAERLEGLSGHAREERERLSKVEDYVKSPQAIETVRAVEGALGKLANQLYEGDVRTRETMKDVRADMVGLSHRLAQIELRDPERVAQGVMDKVVTKLAQRLETAEAQTTGALKALEQAFTTLDKRLTAAEGRGDVSDPEAARSFQQLAANLTRRVEDSRAELLGALNGGLAVASDSALKALEARIEHSERRSAAALDHMAKEMQRVAEGLGQRVATVETTTRDGIKQVAEAVEARFTRTDTGHVQALERLSGEIARISEHLGQKLTESERRTTQILGAIGEQVEQHRDHVREDLSARIRASEERTSKLLDEARARLDQKLAKVQTQALLTETVVRQTATAPRQEDALPNPFGPRPDPAALVRAPAPEPELDADFDIEPVAEAAPYVAPSYAPQATAPVAAVLDEDDDIDLTGRLLSPLTDFKPDFDPFEDDEVVQADQLMEPAPVARPVSAHAPAIDEDDDDVDPFADIEISRKTAPPAREGRSASAFAARSPRPAVASQAAAPDFDITANSREGLDFDDAADEAPVSLSTRDALAAARAAVRASIEGTEPAPGLGNLRPGVSRTREAQPKPAKNQAAKTQGGVGSMAIKASAIAVGLIVIGTGGTIVIDRTLNSQNAKASVETPIAAAAINVVDAPNASLEANLREQYDLVDKSLKARDPSALVKLKALANQGYAMAQYRLGNIYDKDFAALQDKPVEARGWTEKAANGGLPQAMNNLAYMYHNGDGGTQDRTMAAMWFRKAAERGSSEAQFNLGVLYQSGDGVPVSPSDAYKWLSLAAKAGVTGAPRAASDLRGQLTEAQRQAVDTQVAAFVPISDGAPIEASALASD